MSSRKAGIGFILVTLFLDILGIGLVIPILPSLLMELTQGDRSMALRYLGNFGAAYALMQFIFSPVLGSLSDRFGRRVVLLLSMAGAAAGYGILATAPTLSLLLVGRLIAGITGGSLGAAQAYMADVTPPEKRAVSFALVGMMFGLGFTIGPAVGGILGSHDLRLPFWVAGGLSLANTAYGFFVLPESLAPEHRRPFSLLNANPLGALIALAKNPVVLGLAVASFFVNLAQRALETVWVPSVQYRYGWTLKEASYSLAAVGVAAVVVQGGLVRRIVPRLGERKALNLSVFVALVAFTLYGLAPSGWMVYAIIPIGAFAGMSGAASQALMSRATLASEQGLLQGGLTSMVSITQIVGPPLGSHLFAYFISPDAPVQVPGAPFFLGAVLLAIGLGLVLRAEAKAGATVSPPTTA